MKYYLAPLEGITSYVYRNAYHKHFRPMDKYFTPFIVTSPNKKFSTRELKELSQEHNKGLYVVPQLMSNQADDFIKTAKAIAELGYEEMNLNLGCPSGTVVAKKKGSGFLAYPEELDAFLEQIYESLSLKISIKTRIGKESPEEFYRLLEIYNKYPIEELIIHPRVQTDFYRNTVNLEMFEEAMQHSKNPLCYNGDIFTAEDFQKFSKAFPTVDKMMCGRGIIANPALISEIDEKELLTKEKLRAFHDDIYEEYKRISSGDRNTLFKMKELWFYISQSFEGIEKPLKKIRKSEKCKDYDAAVQMIFDICPLK